MPTVFWVGSARFAIRPKEANHSRPHVHIILGNAEASIALDDFEILAHRNFNASDLRALVREVMDYQAVLMEKWTEYHG